MFRASLFPSSGAYQLQQQLLVYRRNMVVAVLLVVVGPVDRPRPTALLPPRSYGKPEAAAAVDRLLMMGIRVQWTDRDQQHCYHHVPTVNQKLLLKLIGS